MIMDMENFYVYQYIRSNSGKHGSAGSPYYVGKGSGRRAWSRNHNTKPPKNPARVEIIRDGMNEADALQAEMLLIHLHGRIDKGTGCLWNRTDGGEFTPAFRGAVCPMKGKKHSAKARARMRAAKLGRKTGPHGAEWNANIAASQRGKIVSSETRAKLRAKNSGPKPPRSPEWCESIRRAKIGRKRPDMLAGSNLQRKAAASRTGKKRGPYRRDRNGSD
jgi:NUMOD3 motif